MSCSSISPSENVIEHLNDNVSISLSLVDLFYIISVLKIYGINPPLVDYLNSLVIQHLE